MGIFKDLVQKSAEGILTGSEKIIDTVVTNDEEKMKLKNELSKIVLDNLTALSQARKEVLIAELQGNWLQRSWRPIVMLSFAAIVLISAFYPVTLHVIPDQFWTMLTIGLGGYIAGRSLEKTADKFTRNTDLTFIKKKDRKISES